ncbi:MAG: thioredoxin family protein [Candidatus Desulfacyla sp.]
MTADEERRISDWHEGLAQEISIQCLVSNDDRTALFRGFCEQMTRLAPGVHVLYRKGDDAKQPPAILLNDRLVYHALPEGPELPPFLETLSLLGEAIPSISREIISRLDTLNAPCLLKLFIAPQCPFCPRTVRDLNPLAIANAWVRLTVVDGLLFPEMAQALNIQSAPTLVFDDRMQWTGQTSVNEILDVVLNQDPSLLSAASMENLLQEGKASMLARMMMAQGTIFPAFYDLITHEKWSVRLGAMVAMEEIIEQDRPLAAQCVGPLWERFPALDQQAQGDVVYILGEAGDRNIIRDLETVLSGPYNAETREAAREALESIAQRPS